MYGTVAASVRGSMMELLDMRRPSFFLGGANGARPETTTAEERAEATGRILRYRKVVWDYATALIEAAIPADTTGWEAPRRLLHWLHIETPQAEALPERRGVSATELCSVQDTRLAEAWRRAAAAAVAGRERELPVVARTLRFDEGRVLVRDAADITWALLTLDARYFPLPGWQRLSTQSKWQDKYGTSEPHRVDSSLSAAQLCSEWARSVAAGEATAVDRAGYHPPSPLVQTPYPFGFDGAIAAQHNLYVRLGAELPSIDSLTAILRAQRQTSALAAVAAQDADAEPLAREFAKRAENHKMLLGMMTARLVSPYGRGQHAAADAAAAQRAMEDAVGTGERADADQLRWLQRLFTMADARIAGRVRQGIDDQRYFIPSELALSVEVTGGVRRAVQKFEPVTGRNHPNLYAAVKRLGRAGEEQRRSVDPNASRARNDFSRMLVRSDALDVARRYGPRPIEYSGAPVLGV